jgi:starch synthase (maltosyl-transferring)
MVVNLDPHQPQEGVITVSYDLGTSPTITATDLLDDTTYHWRLGGNYVRLDPAERPAHVLRVEGA